MQMPRLLIFSLLNSAVSEWSKQECGKERMKRSQGRAKGKRGYESGIVVNGEGNKVSWQTQAERK